MPSSARAVIPAGAAMTKPETTYSCKECGVVVPREGDEFRRMCGVNEVCTAPVIAHLHATAYGESAFAEPVKKAG
jgi:hypothetical protein